MKISKLFHWLYAILMLLPAFFVGGRMAYTIFNKNAYESYSGEQNTYISNYNEYTSNYDKVFTITSRNNYVPYDLSTNTNFIMYLDNINVVYSTLSFNIANANNVTVYLFNSNANAIYFDFKDDNTSIGASYSSSNSFVITCNVINVQGSNNFNTILQYNKFLSYQNNNNTLDNAFDYSMSQLNELPLFSWAKDSFIVQPFTYITGLFGMPSDSPVLTLLSYWCSISLIWLTFDLLMYVPLLVHRWLDKGVLE